MTMSYDKVYSGGWQDGSTGQTPINADALNHMEDGIVAANEPEYKWKPFVSDTITLAANGSTTYAVTGVTLPTIDGYTRFVIPRASKTQAVVTGFGFDSNDHLTVFLRNLTSSSVEFTVRGILMYLSDDNRWE
jgi:hypothetical protein